MRVDGNSVIKVKIEQQALRSAQLERDSGVIQKVGYGTLGYDFGIVHRTGLEN